MHRDHASPVRSLGSPAFAAGLLLFVLQGCGAAVTSADDQDAGTTTGSGGSGTGGSAGSSTGGNAGTSVGGSGGTGTGGSGTGGSIVHPDAAIDCVAGTTTFHLTEASGTDFCVGAQCGNVWVTVKSMSGQVLSLSGGCLTNCSACMPIACAAGGACAAPQHMKPEGQTLIWDGTFQVLSTCGASISCQDQQCAAPGKYVATMCANRSNSDAGIEGFCMADQTPTCVDVPFDYPSATTVEGVVGN